MHTLRNKKNKWTIDTQRNGEYHQPLEKYKLKKKKNSDIPSSPGKKQSSTNQTIERSRKAVKEKRTLVYCW